jgi:hypothetical protein
VVDFNSLNGVYVNGKKISEAFFSVGDIIKIGKTELHVVETLSDEKFVDQDEAEKVKEDKSVNDNVYVPELAPMEGAVIIDNEYCDIIFAEDKFKPFTQIPLNADRDYSDYIDYRENLKVPDILKAIPGKVVEVSQYSCGSLLDIQYYPLKNGIIGVDAKKSNDNTFRLEALDSADTVPFVSIQKGHAKIYPIPNFKIMELERKKEYDSGVQSLELNENNTYCFTRQTIQVFVRINNTPPQLKHASLIARDALFQKELARTYSIMMSLVLLLFLLGGEEEVKKEEEAIKRISIVYKAMPQPEVEVEESLPTAISTKPVADPQRVTEIADQAPPPIEKQTADTKVEETPAPIKAYEFKMKNTLSNLLASTKKIKDVVFKGNSRSITSESPVDAPQTSFDKIKTGKIGPVGNLGAGFKGKDIGTSGVKGLSNKSGFDNSFVSTKLVVMGSMDPELLRKIMEEYLPQFRHCYQQELERNSETIQGVVDLDFRIMKDGKVSNVNVKTKKSNFSGNGISCMTKVLKMIPFPKPKGGGVVDVRQPLNFLSEKGKI